VWRYEVSRVDGRKVGMRGFIFTDGNNTIEGEDNRNRNPVNVGRGMGM
jgi:hypothetical protein